MMADQQDCVTCLFNENGEVLASNPAHAAMLARHRGEVLGQNWREWTAPDQLKASERTFAKALAGEPVGFTRAITRPDGTIAVGRSQLFSTSHAGSRLVIGTMQLILVTNNLVRADAENVSDYIAVLSEELSRMANSSGLQNLGLRLDAVTREAGEIAGLLKRAGGRAH